MSPQRIGHADRTATLWSHAFHVKTFVSGDRRGNRHRRARQDGRGPVGPPAGQAGRPRPQGPRISIPRTTRCETQEGAPKPTSRMSLSFHGVQEWVWEVHNARRHACAICQLRSMTLGGRQGKRLVEHDGRNPTTHNIVSQSQATSKPSAVDGRAPRLRSGPSNARRRRCQAPCGRSTGFHPLVGMPPCLVLYYLQNFRRRPLVHMMKSSTNQKNGRLRLRVCRPRLLAGASPALPRPGGAR